MCTIVLSLIYFFEKKRNTFTTHILLFRLNLLAYQIFVSHSPNSATKLNYTIYETIGSQFRECGGLKEQD